MEGSNLQKITVKKKIFKKNKKIWILNQNDFEKFNLPLIDDALSIQEGPLLGILTSLQKIKTDWGVKYS